MKKTIILSSILFLALAVILFQNRSRSARDAALQENTASPVEYTVIGKDGSQLHRGRIDQLLATLKAEDLQQSVANLMNDSRQYSYPGFQSGRKGGQDDLEVLLSARRATKVVQKIAKMEKAEAASQNRALCDRAFGRYQEVIDRNLQSYENPDAPKNTESLFAAKMAVSTCLLSMALCGDAQELSRQMEQVDAFLKQVQERIDKESSLFPDHYWQLTRHFMQPDNRCVLNLLVYAVMNGESMSSERSEMEALLKDFPQKQVPIVAWDAKTGYYDYVHVQEGIPIDGDRIETTLVVYDWPDNMRADEKRQAELIERICGKFRPAADQ